MEFQHTGKLRGPGTSEASGAAQRALGSRHASTALLSIAGLHTVFGLLIGFRLMPDAQMDRLAGSRVPLLEFAPGFGATADPLSLTMLWFLFFGFALVPLGWLMRSMEARRQPIPTSIAYQLATLGCAGGILVPASGFWLALVPAVLIYRKRGLSGS